ncbi:hypothetical protein CSV74_00270 [Sporosarcina sp. P19]|uniref:S-layer homology domain-containing protein n=1 Tax=Sporosarcina sp. P19 TaxID=2048258 RepID=UPI000C1739DF|nr:S-layer homology domain-containing protein [Sporosarcina sp. P19]PIC77997.1 hypothetical protein CSV74_00270 [Sporosarcina sp. P19]
MRKILSVLLILILVTSFLPIQKTEATSNVFTDVKKNHPNYAAIMYLADKGVIVKQKRFGPNDKVTREEVAIMVAKATGLNGKKTKTKFKDVPASRYSSGYIQSAANARIINGYPDGTFKPTQFVTRGHMAAFIANAFKLTEEGNFYFSDVAKGSTSYNAVRKLAFANITSGYPDGTFKPNQTLTRSHIAAFIARAMEPSFRPAEKEIIARGVYFGASVQQIKKGENAHLIGETTDGHTSFLQYKIVSGPGFYDTTVLYGFEKDKLTSIMFDYFGGIEEYVAWDRLEGFHYNVLEDIKRDLGKPDYYKNDKYSKVSASWFKKGYSVILNADYSSGYASLQSAYFKE